ncbi:MAG: hypothetical protein EAZ77_04495 [Nostocales cyanobacterium]|nr:MAG: hypothetical protein EAZ77_04495 [Nostocales cyanobacterium]
MDLFNPGNCVNIGAITNHRIIMNNWLSTRIADYTFSVSTNNNIILPGLPESPMAPITKMPQANPPMLFLPQASQFRL